MDLPSITSGMKTAIDAEGPLDGTLKLRLAGIGVILIDGDMVTNEDRPVDNVVAVSGDDFAAIALGELDPLTAIMTGRARIEGSLRVAGAFAKILHAARARALV